MSRKVEWAKRAIKEMSRADSTTRERIFSSVESLARNQSGDVRRLQGVSNAFRLRVGGWRVIFSYLEDGSVLVEKVGPRGDIYKK